MVQIIWFCLPRIESYKDTENFELRSLLDGQVIPKNIRDLQEYNKTQWKERFRNFVETTAYNAIIERIKEEQCVIISGPFGCGKSSLAFHTALKLEEALEYDFMIISNPDDLLKYASDYKKQVFLIDDVFGKYSVSEYDTMWWNRQGESLQHLLTRNTNLRLLMTSRLHIYKYLSVNVIQMKVNVCHINLISEDLLLTYEERQTIGRCYLSDDVLDNLDQKVVSLYSNFPALCANFYDRRPENEIQYFSHPLELIQTDFGNIRNSQDLFFLALSVLIVCDNTIQKDFLSRNNHNYDEMLKYISKEIGYAKTPSKQLLRLCLIALTGSYVLEKESSFECLSFNLFNVLAVCIGPSILHSILRYGTMSFIIDKMQPLTSSGHNPKLTIVIPNSLQDNYFERMLLDMKTAHHNIFIGSHQLSVEYRKSFIAYMKNHLKRGDLRRDAGEATVLHFVSEEGYADYVKYFLKLDKQMVKGLDNTGQTALHKTCIKGHIFVAMLLFENGANINQSDNDSKTALDIACESGDRKMVELLLWRNAEVFQKKTDFRSALHVACNDNNLKIAELLLKNNVKAVNQQDFDGFTPLHIACEKGFFEIAMLLISHKAMVEMDDMHGITPLYIACKNCNFREANLLLDNKANANACSEYGNTAIFIASEKKHIEIVRLLINNSANVNFKNKALLTPLHVACQINNIDIASLLIKHGSLVDEQDMFLQTPLFIACSKGFYIPSDEISKINTSSNKTEHTGDTHFLVDDTNRNEETARVLLNAGANVNLSDKNGTTPINMACKVGSVEIVKLLINAGADVNQRNKDDITPIDMALKCDRNEIVSLLRNVNVDVNKGDKTLLPQLHMACEEGNGATVKVLLNSGAIVNEVNTDGMTPLHVACKCGQEEIVTTLINAGVNVNKGDTKGVTPLHIACIERNEAIVKMLLNSNVNVKMKDQDGMTPLDVACKHGHNAIVTLLLNAGANGKRNDINDIATHHMANEGLSEVTTNEAADVELTEDYFLL